MNEEIVRNYLKDEGFELAEKWYLYTLQPEWDYVIFMVRRAYLMGQSSIVIRDSRFVNEFHILKATCKFCTRLSTFVMTFPFFPLLL